jgi:hypothetical protein
VAGPLQTSLEQGLHKPSLQFPPPSLLSLALSTISHSWDETGKAIAFEKEAERQLQRPVCDHRDPSQPLVEVVTTVIFKHCFVVMSV